MAFAIPDVPREISVQIQREKLLATEALYESDLARLKRESEQHTLDLADDETKVRVRRGSRVAQDTFLTNIQHSLDTQQNGHGPPNDVTISRLHLD